MKRNFHNLNFSEKRKLQPSDISNGAPKFKVTRDAISICDKIQLHKILSWIDILMQLYLFQLESDIEVLTSLNKLIFFRIFWFIIR